MRFSAAVMNPLAALCYCSDPNIVAGTPCAQTCGVQGISAAQAMANNAATPGTCASVQSAATPMQWIGDGLFLAAGWYRHKKYKKGQVLLTVGAVCLILDVVGFAWGKSKGCF